jgi:hypothetical protein
MGVDTFHLAVAFRPRSRRDNVLCVGIGEPQLLEDGVLAHAGRTGDDEHPRRADVSQPLDVTVSVLEAGLKFAFQGNFLAD